MSAAARKQMEMMGWKQGQGLGKDGSGIASYVRVQKRDPKLQSGLGHEGGKSGSDNSDMGFDALLSTMSKKDKKARAAADDSSSDNDVAPTTAAAPTKQPDEASSSGVKKRARSRASSNSSSSSDDDSADDNVNADACAGGDNILKWDDATLLKKCGGVRLGRAGRHRFFNGKLNRIDESHK